MAQTERLYKLKAWLDAGRCLSREFLLSELEVSPATLKRDLAHLRDRLNAPLRWDRERRGWRLDRNLPSAGTQYELPGLWFTAEEIHALLTMQHLLAHLDAGGLLGPHIEPLMDRLGRLLGLEHLEVGSRAASPQVARQRERQADAEGVRQRPPAPCAGAAVQCHTQAEGHRRELDVERDRRRRHVGEGRTEEVARCRAAAGGKRRQVEPHQPGPGQQQQQRTQGAITGSHAARPTVTA